VTISKLYGLSLQSMLNKEIDFDTDAIKAALCPAAYVPDQDTHRYQSSIVEVSTVATTLSVDAAAGATSIDVGASIPAGTRIGVGTGTAREIRNVTGVTGTAAPFTLALDSGLTNAHVATEAVQASPGYTAGGVTLTTKTVTYDAATNRLALDCDDPSWPDSSILARYLVIYDSTPGSAAANPLIAYADFESSVTTTNGTLLYQVPAGGFATFTAA
jgi:hypothetical protein